MRRASVLLAVVMASWVGRARAQSASDTALAETLFRDGRELLAAGRIDEACAKLEASQKIDPKIGTLTNLAQCHEQQGKTASAWAEFTEAAALATTMKRANVERYAHEHAVALEARLSRVTLHLSQPAETVQVSLDGKVLTAEAMGVAIPLERGGARRRS
jgi:tetratricopeptide (TPR) repeat protein